MKTTNKKRIFLALIIFLFLVIAIFIINKKGYKVDIEISEIIETANSNKEVQQYIANKQYSVDVGEVTPKEIQEMPAVYKGLEGKLYRIYYRMSDYDLLVVLNNKEVLKVIPITKIRFGGNENQRFSGLQKQVFGGE